MAPDPTPTTYQILLAEDDPTIRKLFHRALSRAGFIVTLCESGARGMQTFEQQINRFDLVITDHDMPGMTGLEMSKKILCLRPDLPIIMVSGFLGDLTEYEILDSGIKKIILKPVDLSDLIESARTLIGSK